MKVAGLTSRNYSFLFQQEGMKAAFSKAPVALVIMEIMMTSGFIKHVLFFFSLWLCSKSFVDTQIDAFSIVYAKYRK